MPRSGTAVSRRRLPVSGLEVSAISVAVDPLGPDVTDDRRVAEQLRKARRFGVTTFDLSESRHPDRAEGVVREAFPGHDPDLVLIVSATSTESPSGAPNRLEPASGTPGDRLLRLSSVARLIGVLGEPAVAFGGAGAEGLRSTGTPPGSALLSDWALIDRLGPHIAGRDETLTSPLLIGPLSLLDHRAVAQMERADPAAGPRYIVRDPYAGGRLDGSRFLSILPERLGPHAPLGLRDLHAEFDPILRLGFLTEGHRRTLAQAALQFALHWEWVATITIPMPTPEQLESVLLAETVPPLTSEEIARVLALGAPLEESSHPQATGP